MQRITEDEEMIIAVVMTIVGNQEFSHRFQVKPVAVRNNYNK